MAKPNGGPAFPVMAQRFGPPTDDVEVLSLAKHGMSLRDWFAGQALGSLFTLDHVQSWERDDFHAAAEYAYRVADAMLAERAK